MQTREKGTHFDANILRSAATIIEKRSTLPKGFWLGVFLRTLRSMADDIDPGCPTASCEHSDGRDDAD